MNFDNLTTANNIPLSIRCIRKNINGYDIYVSKEWQGNGFGYDKHYYIFKNNIYKHAPFYFYKLGEVINFVKS